MRGKNLEKKPNTCIDCGCDISHLNRGSKRCKPCYAKHSGRFEEMVKYIPGFLDNKTEGLDYVVCKICGHKTRVLQPHISHTHKMKPEEYKQMFPNEKLICDEEHKIRSDKFKGKNNPAYNHGGRLSPFSYNNKNKSKDEIDKCKAKAVQSIKNSDKLNSRLTYWLKETNGDVEKAKELLHKRQQTFTLEKCIEKYGENEGYRVWKERQEKWQNTLNSKSEEEKALINKKKLYKNGIVSKAEKELLDNLKKYFDVTHQIMLKYDNIHHYAYDICYKNKIIEYNGDYWHANPKKYKSGDYIKFPRKIMLVDNIWQSDKEKLDFAKSQGYDVLVIWESEYKKDKNGILEKCKNFLMT